MIARNFQEIWEIASRIQFIRFEENRRSIEAILAGLARAEISVFIAHLEQLFFTV